MEKNITSTVNYCSYMGNFANMSNCTFEVKCGIVGGNYTDNNEVKKAVNESINDTVTICGMISTYGNITEKRSMPLSRFIELATPVEKRKNGNYIFRTIKTNTYSILVYDIEHKNTFTVPVTAKSLDRKTARKIYTEYENKQYSIIDIITSDVIESCYMIDVITFVNNSEKVDNDVNEK